MKGLEIIVGQSMNHKALTEKQLKAFLDAVMFSSYYDLYVTDKLVNMAVIKRTNFTELQFVVRGTLSPSNRDRLVETLLGEFNFNYHEVPMGLESKLIKVAEIEIARPATRPLKPATRPTRPATRPSKPERSACARQTTKKYTSRGSPPYNANECCDKTIQGNDGLMWTSRANKLNICSWRKS